MPDWLNNQEIIEWGGLAAVTALVYIETGFLIGLVVPGGETLLFTTGLLAGTGVFSLPLIAIIGIVIVAAILGDFTGYYIGSRLGEKLHKKEETWYFKPRYLDQTEKFYKKYGASALIVGRFVPVVRTLNPLLSGTGKIAIKNFGIYVVAGVVIYTSSLVLLGYFLGNEFPWLKDHLAIILPALVLILISPLIIKLIKNKKATTSK